MAANVEVCLKRIGGIRRLWSKPEHRDDFEALSKRVDDLEGAYDALEGKVTDYLKDLHHSGILTIAEEVFS